ncbi:MAG: transglutaminase domain-containing protein [Patescibacteria group bacterium]|jgi:hypothetical protein
MRGRILLVALLVLLLLPQASSATTYHDYGSSSQSMNWTIERKVVVTISGFSSSNLSSLWVYVLRPRLDFPDEWDSFCSVSSINYTYSPIAGYSEDFSQQWELVGFDLRNTSFVFPQTFEIRWTARGTRGQTLNGVDDDYIPEPGAYYTSYTTSIPEIPDLTAFAVHARDNPLTNMVTGYVGVEQRGMAKVRTYGGNCTSMSKALCAYMRSLNIPTCFVSGINVAATIQLPVGTGTITRTFDNGGGTVGHCETGIWNNWEGTWMSSDPANATASGMAHLQFLPISYVEEPSMATNFVYLYGTDAERVFMSISSTFEDVSSSAENQSYTWSAQRTSGEFTGQVVYAQKPASSFKGGLLFEPGGDVTGVGDDPPGVPTPLAVFPASQRPVRPGEQLFVEVGAPPEGVEASLRMFDVRGRMVPDFGFEGRTLSGYNAENIQVPDSLGSGVYFLLLTFNGRPADRDRIVILR